MKLSLTFSSRLALLALLLVLGMILSGAFSMLLGKVTGNVLVADRISVVVNDLLAFVLPAIILALLLTRLPAEFLMIKSAPKGGVLLWSLLALVVAFPAIALLTDLCTMLPWPESVVRAESEAAAKTMQLLGPHNVVNLLVSVLIVGVLAGVSEELFFRGALQRVLQTRPMSVHLAIWLAAAFFSLMHAQPVGFIPRMLLGAFFGYAAVWSGSLWTAVILHVVNNTVAIITMWAGVNLLSTPAVGVVSAAIAAYGIRIAYSRSRSSGM